MRELCITRNIKYVCYIKHNTAGKTTRKMASENLLTNRYIPHLNCIITTKLGMLNELLKWLGLTVSQGVRINKSEKENGKHQ